MSAPVAVGVATSGGGRELLGALVAGCSALLYDAGYVLEKQALSRLPEMRFHPGSIWRAATRSRRWSAGFAAMLAGLSLQVVALTLAPVSVVQPILAAGLIALAAASSSLLGERLDRRHTAALLLILAAVVCTAASARGADALARSVPVGRFVVLAVIVAVVGGVCGRLGICGSARGRARRALIGAALSAGLLYGLGAVAEKAVATRLVSDGLVRGAWSALSSAYPWLFVAATLAGMLLFQMGLQAHPASLMASLTNVTSTVCALVGASTVFGEALLPQGWWALVRLAGFAAVLAAVGVLAAEDPATDRLARADHAVAP